MTELWPPFPGCPYIAYVLLHSCCIGREPVTHLLLHTCVAVTYQCHSPVPPQLLCSGHVAVNHLLLNSCVSVAHLSLTCSSTAVYRLRFAFSRRFNRSFSAPIEFGLTSHFVDAVADENTHHHAITQSSNVYILRIGQYKKQINQDSIHVCWKILQLYAAFLYLQSCIRLRKLTLPSE